MLNKFFSKPVEIKIGEQIFKFCSIADFEFSMTGRTAVPSKKITDMVKFSTDQLKREARTIKDIEKQFVSILSRSIEETSSINRALRELDPLIFSQDHSWRDIISALNEGDEELNPFRRIALVKYMQYLSSRQEIIKYLYNEKKKLLKEPDSVETPKFKDTLLLDNTVFEPIEGDGAGKEVERMPKGEAVTVTLKPNEEISVILSKHICKLSAKNGIQFTDQAGRTYTLGKGRNIIGRDTVSNVIMEPSLKDVSRLHLVIENYDDNTLQLTDLSSHGTYIPLKFIEQHSS
ncbi:MAG: FHA domain-containing protein [Gammaproteobacteria bacterium]